jgi:MoxR-like ATPase
MLLGGPGSGKTLILDAIYEASSNPLYVNMADASVAGIEDLVVEAGCFDVILLDEVDKAKNVALSPLLQLLDHGGRLRITKSGKTTVIEAPWVRAVAAANPFNPRLRASNWWMPLIDRFVPIEVPQPSVDEILTFMSKVANAEMPNWVRELIEKYIDAITLRKAEQAAKYIAASMRRGRSEDVVRARVDRILQTTRRLVTREHKE